MNSITVRLQAEQDTRALGRVLAESIGERCLIALSGTLGAGKTTLVQGLGEGLGVDELINSPTFTMMNEYHSGRTPLYHLDLYRLGEDQGQVAELLMVELEEILNSDVVAVFEWAELFVTGDNRSFLDSFDYLTVSLEYGGEPIDQVKASEAGKKKSSQILPINKDEGRTAVLKANGPESNGLIKILGNRLDVMFICS